MASFQLLPQLHLRSPPFSLLQPKKSCTTKPQNSRTCTQIHRISAIINGENVATDSPQPSRRTRKKTFNSPSSSSSKTKKSRPDELKPDPIDENYDDGIDFPYEDPPLICCFGSAQKEFVPTVRVWHNPMDQDMYSQWKMLQWDPPEFVRAPGGPPSNVAISHVRLGGRAAFMGKVGDDDFGNELVLMMNKEKVQTRGVKIDENVKTACSYMKIKFDDDNGRMRMEKVKDSADNCLRGEELNLAVLKEVMKV